MVKAFVIFWLVILIIRVVTRLICLSVLDYPRITENTKGRDATAMFFQIVGIIWIILIFSLGKV